jgi:uncharacterized membrane protein (DUF2068 family)
MSSNLGHTHSHLAASEHGRHAKILRAVATVELAKGVAVLALGVLLLSLIHKDPWDITDRALHGLHINSDRRIAQFLLDWADRITVANLWTAAGFAFAYSILRFIEAYGLWNARIWAEWFAIISGTLYLPLELMAIRRHPDRIHFLLLVFSLAIILYMAYLRFTSNRRSERERIAATSLKH